MKLFKIKLSITLLFILSLFEPCIFAQNTVGSNLDVVLVLDVSASMLINDQKQVTKTGANLFIEMLGTNSRVAVVAFNHRIAFDTALKEMNNISNRHSLADQVNALNYAGATDIGLALSTAAKKLSDSLSNNTPVIILLTDGRIDTGNAARNENSRKDIDALLINPIGPIFTIGLAREGNASNIDVDLLNRIAAKSNAKSFVAGTAAELPAIFTDVFSSMIKSELVDVGSFSLNEEYSDIVVDIPDAVAEVSIILQADSGLADVTIADPLGHDVSLNTGMAYISTIGGYSVLKIILPVRGEWKLRAKGSGAVKVNLTYNYDINLIALTAKTRYEYGETVTIFGQLSDNYGLQLNNELLSSLKANLYILNEAGIELETHPMLLKDRVFMSDVKLPEQDATLQFVVKVDGYKFYREDTIKVRIGTQKPFLKREYPVSNGE